MDGVVMVLWDLIRVSREFIVGSTILWDLSLQGCNCLRCSVKCGTFVAVHVTDGEGIVSVGCFLFFLVSASRCVGCWCW